MFCATLMNVPGDEGGTPMSHPAKDLPHPRHWTTGSPERPPQHLDAPVLNYQLADDIAEVRHDEEYKKYGHSAKVLVKDGELRLVLIAIQAGARVPDYQVSHRVAIEALEGRVDVVTPNRSIPLSAGSLVSLAAEIVHHLEAREDSAVLLTIPWHADDQLDESRCAAD